MCQAEQLVCCLKHQGSWTRFRKLNKADELHSSRITAQLIINYLEYDSKNKNTTHYLLSLIINWTPHNCYSRICFGNVINNKLTQL